LILTLLAAVASAAPCMAPIENLAPDARGFSASYDRSRGLELLLVGGAACAVALPKDVSAADALIAALARVPGTSRRVPADLVAAVAAAHDPKVLAPTPGAATGVHVRGLVSGRFAVVVLEQWSGSADCVTGARFEAWTREGDVWTSSYGPGLAWDVRLACIAPKGRPVSPTCTVPWDGGIVCDSHMSPNCGEDEVEVAFGCRPYCVDRRTCGPTPR
jgi:hypothetical protein